MRTEKYCGICCQKIGIEYEYKKKVKTKCPNCESESEWTFYKNGNFREVIHLSDKALKIRESMERERNAV